MKKKYCGVAVIVALFLSVGIQASADEITVEAAKWTPTGWGGGGFYYAAAYHPTKDGVIYMAGDVLGCYKSEDHGRSWRMINNGIAGYGVFSLAVDPTNPETVYAATTDGLCKSTDGGEHWQVLPNTGRGGLRLTGEKKKSIRSVAVDPTDGDIVYAASPSGKVYKSTDGGQAWNLSYEKKPDADAVASLRVQFGRVNNNWFGGIWFPVKFPAAADAANTIGLGFSFKGDGTQPQNTYLTIRTTTGAVYRSKDLRGVFANEQWHDVVLTAEDISLDPKYVKKNPDKAAALPATPDWATVNRLDFGCVGPPNAVSKAKIGKVFFAFSQAADGTATSEKPSLQVVKDFAATKKVRSYGNVRVAKPGQGSIYSVAVSEQDPSLVLAATHDSGLVMSDDAGQTWRELATPKRAANAVFTAADSNTIYATFHGDGVWKSTDKGSSWTNISPKTPSAMAFLEVAVSPANPDEVYVIGIGLVGWTGTFYYSDDGGKTWTKSATIAADPDANPTLPLEAVNGKVPLSRPRNLAINPNNPKELFIAANWYPCISRDAGRTWTESSLGADISCITDIRFRNGRTYVTAMDEGTLVSDNGGQSWKQLWPLKYNASRSGHNWRVAVADNGQGGDRIISTVSPWGYSHSNRVFVSEDSGKTYKVVTEGLPDYIPTRNTMWGRSYARALAVDPNNPDIMYLGMDGDPSQGKSGGGIFKSVDGGYSWEQLANQPKSRRIFFGLAVDPTDSNRIYAGAGGSGAGLYRSEDAGNTWKRVFNRDGWTFNVHVTDDGTVYCPGVNLWRSRDHGKSWKKITKFPTNIKHTIVGLEVNPNNPDTIWISKTTWGLDAVGGVYKTTDGGTTWSDITGDLPYRKPLVLRFNPDTNELWAGFVGMYKIKQ